MQNIYINHISPPTGEAGERINEKDTNKGTKGKKEEMIQSTSPEERNRY